MLFQPPSSKNVSNVASKVGKALAYKHTIVTRVVLRGRFWLVGIIHGALKILRITKSVYAYLYVHVHMYTARNVFIKRPWFLTLCVDRRARSTITSSYSNWRLYIIVVIILIEPSCDRASSAIGLCLQLKMHSTIVSYAADNSGLPCTLTSHVGQGWLVNTHLSLKVSKDSCNWEKN